MEIAAAVWRAPGAEGTIETVELDPPRSGEVLVEVMAAGVCHSDLHLAMGDLGSRRFPTVLGHEGAGIVAAVGAEVSHVSVGDRVAFCFIPACGTCRYCRAGRRNLCEPGSAAAFRGTMLDGSRRLHLAGTDLQHFLAVACFASHAVVPAASLVSMPDRVAFEQAALAGCATVTGFGAVRNAAHLRPDQDVAVIGCGGVGLQVITAARLAGAQSITAVDRSADKAELARRHGATATSTELEGDFDVVFEVVGLTQTIRSAWDHLRPGGTVVVVGIPPVGSEVSIPAIEFASDKSLRGSFYGSGNPGAEIAAIMELIAAGEIDPLISVTHRAGLEGINEAFGRLRRGEGGRTVVKP